METIILKLTCKDKKGIIAKISSFIYEHSGNIVNLDQYTDKEKNLFFMRLEWEESGFDINEANIDKNFAKFLSINNINGDFSIYFSKNMQKCAIFVSKYDHCLFDILLRHKSGELKCQVPLIISNHIDLEKIAKYFNIDFYHLPIDIQNKEKTEKKQIDLLKKYNIDFVVLARYMQIVSANFISFYPNKIINIHHSFLPAFKGAKPYHQAYERGVKIIGATSHFVTEQLDQGPIIMQDIIHVSHKDNIDSMIIKGRDIERRVLSNAVNLYIENRIFLCENRTIIL
ncbi:MAG: formyltetrahydrofolate deformylase [Spirochaetes bacterium]|nr:formyltetrahydrofolate deformylase [Spirochaetota bacterium]